MLHVYFQPDNYLKVLVRCQNESMSTNHENIDWKVWICYWNLIDSIKDWHFLNTLKHLLDSHFAISWMPFIIFKRIAKNQRIPLEAHKFISDLLNSRLQLTSHGSISIKLGIWASTVQFNFRVISANTYCDKQNVQV